MKLTKRHIWIGIIIIVGLLIIWVMSHYWTQFSHLIKILIVAIIIAYVLTPLCEFLEKKLPRSFAIGLIILTLGSIITAFILLFIPRMINEFTTLVERFPLIMQYIRNALGTIQNRMETMGIPKGIQDSITSYADTFQKKATDTTMKSLERMVTGVAILPSLFIELVLGFYFLKDREYFGEMLKKLITIPSRRKILPVASEINHILHRFIRGEVLIATTVGILATVGYLLVGLPYALTLGFIAGILEFIPYFGPWLGAIPALIIAYLSGSQTFIWTLIVVLLIQQLEGVLITPRILSGVVNLHPVYVILSLWAGGLFFGIAGMFLAVPSVLILRVIIKHVYLNIVAIK
ncbi:MAG: AI-2E family transporter [Clostridiales bacterium]|nr:AI-2E family transporter [Clostridiales bacterium]